MGSAGAALGVCGTQMNWDLLSLLPPQHRTTSSNWNSLCSYCFLVTAWLPAPHSVLGTEGSPMAQLIPGGSAPSLVIWIFQGQKELEGKS